MVSLIYNNKSLTFGTGNLNPQPAGTTMTVTAKLNKKELITAVYYIAITAMDAGDQVKYLTNIFGTSGLFCKAIYVCTR